jgi:hypothetical protein
MKTSFIDTNVIDFCIKSGMDAQDFKALLNKYGYFPVIGSWTVYEHARCYKSKLETMKSNFAFILNLQPFFSCPRNMLYLYEYQALTGRNLISPLLFLHSNRGLAEKVAKLSKGIIDSETEKVIQKRNINVDEMRSNWKPSGMKNLYKKYNDFDARKKYILEILPKNKEAQIATKQLFSLFNFEISDVDLLSFIKNINAYPAFRTLLYQHLYLDFSSEKNNKRPAKDKLPDGIQVIEASYCRAFITGDQNLLNKHGKFINSDIEWINIFDLIKVNPKK